jgi:hypothetical protein
MMKVAVVVATGCGSVASAALCEPPLAGDAVLAAARDALDERRLVGTAASVLSTLAGARGGTVGATLRTRRQETLGPDQSKNTVEEAITYLRVENPLFLFLGGSADVVAATGVAAAAPPAISAARVGASAARDASLVGCLVAGAPAPPRRHLLRRLHGSGQRG